MIHKARRLVVTTVLVMLMVFGMTLPAFALENKTDTVWGTTTASAYITLALYQDGDTIKIPKSYLDSVADGDTYIAKATAAYYEAYKQSAYLFMPESVSFGESGEYVILRRTSLFDDGVEAQLMKTLEITADRIVSEIISPSMSEYDKAVAIYNYVRNARVYDWKTYDIIVGDNWRSQKKDIAYGISAYGTLMQGVSVCQGDSQAYNLLARKAGLTSMLSSGLVNGTLNHAWNRVWANGQWYDLDCTYSLFCSSFSEYSSRMGGVVHTNNGMLQSSVDVYLK